MPRNKTGADWLGLVYASRGLAAACPEGLAWRHLSCGLSREPGGRVTPRAWRPRPQARGGGGNALSGLAVAQRCSPDSWRRGIQRKPGLRGGAALETWLHASGSRSPHSRSRKLGISHRSVSSRRPTSGVNGKPKALSRRDAASPLRGLPPRLSRSQAPARRRRRPQVCSVTSRPLGSRHSAGHATQRPTLGSHTPELHPEERFKSSQVRRKKKLGKKESSY